MQNDEFFNCFSSARVIDVHTSTIVGIERHYNISIQYLFINADKLMHRYKLSDLKMTRNRPTYILLGEMCLMFPFYAKSALKFAPM